MTLSYLALVLPGRTLSDEFIGDKKRGRGTCIVAGSALTRSLLHELGLQVAPVCLSPTNGAVVL